MNSKWNTKEKHLGLDRIKKNNIIKKAAITLALFSTLTFNLAFANEETSKDSINKIYHIYLEDTYIGPVSNEETVTDVIETKELEASKEFEDFQLDASSSITVVPEQVFSHNLDDSSTIEKLNAELEVQTDAYALTVNDEQVAYFKNQQDYEAAIRKLKLNYVTEQELQQLEGNSNKAADQKDTRLVELSIVEETSGEEAKVNPSKILTPENAVAFLKSGSIEKQLYSVKAGDVLGSIAKQHNLTTAQLLELNPDLNIESLLQIGQKINVTVEKPLVNVQVVYEKVREETIPFKNIVEENEAMYKGEKKVKQEGSNGKKEVSYLIKELNGATVEKTITEEKVLAEPKDQVEIVGTKVVSSRGTGSFAWPTSGGYVSSNMGNRWGDFHRGIDIARPSNYNIKATDNGVVTFVGWDGTYGQKIVINHNNGYESLYAHLSEIHVNVGQVVPQGTVIGIMGSTGRSTGTHLHFEVHKGGSYVNPLSLLN